MYRRRQPLSFMDHLKNEAQRIAVALLATGLGLLFLFGVGVPFIQWQMQRSVNRMLEVNQQQVEKRAVAPAPARR